MGAPFAGTCCPGPRGTIFPEPGSPRPSTGRETLPKPPPETGDPQAPATGHPPVAPHKAHERASGGLISQSTRRAFTDFCVAAYTDLRRLAGHVLKVLSAFLSKARAAKLNSNISKPAAADGRRGPLLSSVRAASTPALASLGHGLRWMGHRFRARPLLSTLATGAVLATAVLVWALHDISLSTITRPDLTPVLTLSAADGSALSQQGAYRLPDAALEAIPEHVVQAVVSAEDRRFYDHGGLDFRGIGRALLRNLGAGEVVEGGSTITQQLLKVLHLDPQRTFRRKIQEAILAVWLELRLSKQEILSLYLNNIYLGRGAAGLPAAARLYFDKDVSELSVAEGAVLAGLIKAPSHLNPVTNLTGAREQATRVLDTMATSGHLNEDAAAKAKRQLAQLRTVKGQTTQAGSWFADWVLEDAREIAGPLESRVDVRTTLRLDLQELANKAVTEELRRSRDPELQAALVAMRPDGAVVAMVGGRDYAKSQFNRATQAMRQPGSAFKLFVYYAALKAGMSLDSSVLDEPVEIDGWTPENADRDFLGEITAAEAFARSRNAAAVRIAQKVGTAKVIEAARELGVDAPLAETPSLALGTSGMSLIDLTGAYASVRAGRAPVEPWGISSFAAATEKAFAVAAPLPGTPIAHQAELVTLLKLVVDHGTGRKASLPGFAAGKTGTSQNNRDAWFVGFTSELVVGVWVGKDDETPMKDIAGGDLPATIWRSFMARAAHTERSLERDTEDRVNAGPLQCDVRACARMYRSFRAADCSYQPYSGGPRRMCER